MGINIRTTLGWTICILGILILIFIVWKQSNHSEIQKEDDDETYPLTTDKSFMWIFPTYIQSTDGSDGSDGPKDECSEHSLGEEVAKVDAIEEPSIRIPAGRKLCKHNKLKKVFSRTDPNNPYNLAKQRGFLTLADFKKSGVSLKEGYTTMTYPSLVAPFDSTYNVNVANQNGMYGMAKTNGVYATMGANPALSAGLRMQCGTTCTTMGSCYTETNGCWAIGQGQASSQVFNVDFSDPNGLSNANSPIRQAGFAYQAFCSDWGLYNTNNYWGSSLFAAWQYNADTRPWINDCLYNQRQSVAQTCAVANANLFNFASNVITPVSYYQNIINTNAPVGSLTGGFWSYPGNGTENNDTSSLGASWKGGYWDQSHKLMQDMVSTMQSAWTACNNANNQILDEGLNNCSNQNSQIDANGMNICNLSGLQQETQQQCQLALTYATNAGDTNTQAIINQKLSYDPVNPGGQKLKDIHSTLQNNFDYCLSVYDQCSNPNTLLDPSGLIACAGTQLSESYNTCQAALNAAVDQSDPIGENLIMTQWNTTTADNLIGNSLSQVNSILSAASAYCSAQVAVYNQWETEELEAANAPCNPEAPIVPSWEPGLTNQVQTWNVTSLNYLTALNNRLQVILTYLQNTPNCITFDASGVSILPPGSAPVVTITGNPPNQVLAMSIPEGNPGPQGAVGPMGGSGNAGNQGVIGATGAPGIWEIPQQYTNVFSSS